MTPTRILALVFTSTRDHYKLACEQALHLGDIVKSRHARGDAKAPRLRCSLASAGAALFARPNRRACSQANYKLDRATIHRYFSKLYLKCRRRHDVVWINRQNANGRIRMKLMKTRGATYKNVLQRKCDKRRDIVATTPTMNELFNNDCHVLGG